jgi:hypothetical protein
VAKLSLTLAAFLVFAPRVILAQAPDGAAPAPRGPDAVAANLVNTVCASCHSLDRVNGKKADRDSWTTTVAGVRGLGANLTDEQVPVVVEFLTRTAGTLTVAAPYSFRYTRMGSYYGQLAVSNGSAPVPVQCLSGRAPQSAHQKLSLSPVL